MGCCVNWEYRRRIVRFVCAWVGCEGGRFPRLVDDAFADKRGCGPAARVTGKTVYGGRCEPGGDDGGWRVVAC